MFGFSAVGILAIGFIAVLVLWFLGRRSASTILLGLMTVITPLTWYGSLLMLYSSFQMTLVDVLVLALLSAIGGIIIGVGLQYKSGLKQAS